MECPYKCGWRGTPEEYSKHYERCPNRPRTPGRQAEHHSNSSPEEEEARPEIEVYCQGKKFIAHSKEELDRILGLFKGWHTSENEGTSYAHSPEESTWQTPVYKEMKKGDLIRLRGRIGELLSDATYKVGLYRLRESGLYYADVRWNDGETTQNFMVNLIGLEWQPKHSTEHSTVHDLWKDKFAEALARDIIAKQHFDRRDMDELEAKIRRMLDQYEREWA
jgi:hypothetical protein